MPAEASPTAGIETLTAGESAGSPTRRPANLFDRWFGRSDTRFRLAAAAIVLLAAFLRLVRLSSTSLSIDELNDHSLVTAPFWDSLSSGNGFPPGYSLVVRSIDWLLPAPIDQRLISVVFGLGVVVVGSAAARRWLGTWAVLPVMAVLALHPSLVQLSREARPYALEHLSVALVLLCLSPPVRKRSLLPFSIALSMLLLSTYTSVVFAAIAALIVVAPRIRAKRWRELVVPVALWTATSIFVLLAITSDIKAQRSLSGVYPASLDYSLGGVKRFVFAITSMLFGFSAFGAPRTRIAKSDAALFIEATPFLVATVVVFGLALLMAVRRIRTNGALSRTNIELLALVVAPIATWMALSMFAGFDFRGRYFAFTAIPLTLLIVQFLAELAPRVRVAIAVVLVVLAGIGNLNRLFVDDFQNSDYRALSHFLASYGKRSDEYYFIPGAAIGMMQEYDDSLGWLTEAGKRGPYSFGEMDELLSQLHDQTLDLSACSYLVIADLDLIDTKQSFLPYLAARGITLDARFSSTGVQVFEMCGMKLPERHPD